MRPGSRATHIHRLAPPRRPTPLAGRKQWPLSRSRPASDPCRSRTSYMSASMSSPRDSISHDDQSDQVHGKKNRAQLDVYVSARIDSPLLGSSTSKVSAASARAVEAGRSAVRSVFPVRGCVRLSVGARCACCPSRSAIGPAERSWPTLPLCDVGAGGQGRHPGGTGRPCSRKNESLSQ